MSTLRVNTLQNASGVEVYTAKAWVNFNGTGTVAIRASGNVSSITDNGTGLYTINLSTAMPDSNYSVVASVGSTAVGGVSGNGIDSVCTGAPSTSSIQIATNIDTNQSGARADVQFIFVSFFR